MIDRFLPKVRSWIDAAFIEELRSFHWHPSIEDSARHVLVGAGKALRPACLIWSYAQFTQSDANTKPPHHVLQWALALEMVHTYSLVHDDLPAMDNDAFRRGRPTLHILKTDADAILAGDALLTGAFELVARSEINSGKSRSAAVRELAQAAGGAGMIAGQVRDMHAEKTRLENVEQLQRIHNEKTGALFGSAFVLGALAVEGANPTQCDAVRRWGIDLGLLFQIVDDVLDVTASREALGKSPGKDIAADKLTYVSALGLDGARKAAHALASQLGESFPLPQKIAARELVDFVLDRKS